MHTAGVNKNVLFVHQSSKSLLVVFTPREVIKSCKYIYLLTWNYEIHFPDSNSDSDSDL